MSYKPKIIGATETPANVRVCPLTFTVITVDQPVAEKVSFKPTVMVSSVQEEQKPVEKVAFVVKASAMRGEVRKSLDPERFDLKNRFPGVDDSILSMLRNRLPDFVVETMKSLDCEKLGRGIQEEFNDLLSQSLVILQDSSIKSGQRHLGRMREILTETIEKLDKGEGFFRRKIEPKKILDEVAKEMLQLKTLLSSSINSLDNVKKSLATQIDLIEKIGMSISVESMVIDILIDEVKTDDLNNILVQRGISLGQTVAQIKSQQIYFAASMESFQTLAESMHDAVFVQTPAILQCIMMTDDGELSDTQKYVLTDSLKNFIVNLT